MEENKQQDTQPSSSPNSEDFVDNPNEDNNQNLPTDPRKSLPAACVYIAFFSLETTTERAKEHFENLYGPVIKVTIRKGRTRPFGFVQFEKEEDANKAIEDSGIQFLDSQRIRVERAKVNSTLFVAKVQKSINNAELRKMAEEFGEVEQVLLLTDANTHESKRCGFVKFKYREDATTALVEFKTKYPYWIVEWAESSNELESNSDKTVIFIGGLDTAVKEEVIREKFGVYGEIKSINMIEPKSENKSLVCFIRYTEPLSATKAIENENNIIWFGKRIRVQRPEVSKKKQNKDQRNQNDRDNTKNFNNSRTQVRRGKGGNVNQINQMNPQQLSQIPMMPPHMYPFVPPQTNQATNTNNRGKRQSPNMDQTNNPPYSYPYFVYFPAMNPEAYPQPQQKESQNKNKR